MIHVNRHDWKLESDQTYLPFSPYNGSLWGQKVGHITKRTTYSKKRKLTKRRVKGKKKVRLTDFSQCRR
jgi:hypothetical protein